MTSWLEVKTYNLAIQFATQHIFYSFLTLTFKIKHIASTGKMGLLLQMTIDFGPDSNSMSCSKKITLPLIHLLFF